MDTRCFIRVNGRKRWNIRVSVSNINDDGSTAREVIVSDLRLVTEYSPEKCRAIAEFMAWIMSPEEDSVWTSWSDNGGLCHRNDAWMAPRALHLVWSGGKLIATRWTRSVHPPERRTLKLPRADDINIIMTTFWNVLMGLDESRMLKNMHVVDTPNGMVIACGWPTDPD